MVNEDLKKRTKDFAVRIIRLYAALPKSTEAQIVGKQVVRSGTSIGAQYRECHFAKSDADFISKIEGSLQELEETAYWLELLDEMNIYSPSKLLPLRQETTYRDLCDNRQKSKSPAQIDPRCRIPPSRLYPFSFILYPLVWLQAPHKDSVVNPARRGIEQP